MPRVLALAVLLASSGAVAAGAPLLRPEGNFAIGATTRPCGIGTLSSYYRQGNDVCMAGQLLGRVALGIGPNLAVGLRQVGYLDRNTLAWGSSVETRFNVPVGPVQLFLSGGVGPGAARQSDPLGVRSTGVGWYGHAGAGARLTNEGKGGAYLEFALEAQRWQNQGRLAQGGIEEHVNLSQPYFSLALGWTPPYFSGN